VSKRSMLRIYWFVSNNLYQLSVILMHLRVKFGYLPE